MQRKSWNDINNEDSSQSSSQEDIVEVINLHKTISAPTSISSRLKQACDELSLNKIQKHEEKDVWLYIPNAFNSKTDDVHKILQSNSELKNVIFIKNIGWNVLAQKEISRKLIKEGYTKDSIFIKFIYSNRNDKYEQKHTNDSQKNIKLAKKKTYIQKNTKTVYQEKQKNQILQQQPQKEQSNHYPLKNDKQEKKKPKWVQKSRNSDENKQEINSQVSILSFQNIRSEILSPKRDIRQYEHKSPKYKQKYIQSKSTNNISKQPLSPRYKPKYQEPNKNSLANKNQITNEQIAQNKPKKVQKQLGEQSITMPCQVLDPKDNSLQKLELILKTPDKRQSDEQDDSHDSLDKKQKKKKKKKKKNKTAKKQIVPDNNPFSYLVK